MEKWRQLFFIQHDFINVIINLWNFHQPLPTLTKFDAVCLPKKLPTLQKRDGCDRQNV